MGLKFHEQWKSAVIFFNLFVQYFCAQLRMNVSMVHWDSEIFPLSRIPGFFRSHSKCFTQSLDCDLYPVIPFSSLKKWFWILQWWKFVAETWHIYSSMGNSALLSLEVYLILQGWSSIQNLRWFFLFAL